MLIPGRSIPGALAPPVPVPITHAPGLAAPGPSPQQLIDAMLKLATVYRSVETDHSELLQMEKVTTLLQQILSDRQRAASRPILGGGGFGGQ